jgi:taurine transport system permease protein
MKPTRRPSPTIISALLLISAASILWFVLTAHQKTDLFFPSPQSVWAAIVTLGDSLWVAALITFLRVFGGWLVGVVLGIKVGLWMTRSRLTFVTLSPIIEILRPLPPVALIPFFILWFGTGPYGQVGLIALGCFMVMAVNSYVSARNLPAIYLRAGLCLGASRAELYRSIVLPGILPELVSGLRIAAALAFGTGVAAEFMGAQSGLGYLIMVSRHTLNTNVILLCTIVIGIESYSFDFLLRAFCSLFLRWKENISPELQLMKADSRKGE